MKIRPRFVHVFSTFGRGGPQIRAIQLIHHMGRGVEHVVQAMDGVIDAQAVLDERARVHFVEPPARGTFFATRRGQAEWLQTLNADIVLTYNWGAIETVAAARGLKLPLVHHEDGFGPEEIDRLLMRRNWMRRWLLRGVPVIVPSRGLHQIARSSWGVHANHFVNGVDLHRFSPAPDDPVDMTIGSVGALRPEKDYLTLIRAVAKMQRTANLRLVGGGPLEAELRAECARLGIEPRVSFAGFTDDTAEEFRRFSIFAMSSRTEQMPIALVEAMACGLPVVATDVGDIREMVATPNRALIVRPGDPAALAEALDKVAGDRDLRLRLGAANRADAVRCYEDQVCLDRYVKVYDRVRG